MRVTLIELLLIRSKSNSRHRKKTMNKFLITVIPKYLNKQLLMCFEKCRYYNIEYMPSELIKVMNLERTLVELN